MLQRRSWEEGLLMWGREATRMAKCWVEMSACARRGRGWLRAFAQAVTELADGVLGLEAADKVGGYECLYIRTWRGVDGWYRDACGVGGAGRYRESAAHGPYRSRADARTAAYAFLSSSWMD
mgnify:CR=1 FL=1